MRLLTLFTTTALTLTQLAGSSQVNATQILSKSQDAMPQTLAQANSRQTEAERLFQQGSQQARISQFQEALQSWEQALEIYREIGDRAGEAKTLNIISIFNQLLDSYPAHAEAERLFQQGNQQYRISQFREALQSWEQALEIYREIGDRVSEAKILNNIGEVNRVLGNYPTALDYYEQSLVITREIDNRATEAYTLNNIGIVNQSLGNYPTALDYYEQSLVITREIGDRATEALTLNNIGEVNRVLGNYPTALDYYEQSLVITREIGDRATEAYTLNNIGIVNQSLGSYPTALDYYEQSLVITREIGDRATEVLTLNNIGLVNQLLSNYPTALDYYEQSLVITREIGDRATEALTLNNIGLVNQLLSNYPTALDYYEQSLVITREIGDRATEAYTLNNIGLVNQLLGSYPTALDYYERSLVITREIGNRAGEANALGNIGSVTQLLDNYPTALEYYQQSLVIIQEIGDRAAEALILNNIGNVNQLLGNYPTALKYYQQSLVITREIGNRAGEAKTLNNIGLVSQLLGSYPTALENYEQSLVIMREIGDRAGEAQALNNQGVTLLRTDQLSQAETVLLQSINTYESLRLDLSDSQLISIADTQAQAYTNLEYVLTAQNKVVEALEITERARARALVLQLARRLATPDEQAALAASPIAQAPTVEEIQQIARETNTPLVTYSLIFNEALHIWVIQPTGDITFRQVDLSTFSENALLTFVQQTRESMGVRSRADVAITTARQRPRISRAEQTQNLKQLHQLLIDPIADLLPTDPNERVVFIPHQSLFLVPFAALMDTDGTYLIEKHTILTAPSIQVLSLTQELQTANGNGRRPLSDLSADELLIVGNPTMPRVWNPEGNTQTTLSNLPGAEAEALQVAEFLGTKALTGAAATEPAVRQQMTSARLIHLATHGLLEYGLPEESGVRDFPGAIALAPDATVDNSDLAAPGDGLLTAAELLEMDLNAELVVLSACNTGRGRITGDGVVGLSRALITAGVPSIIVSLWSVPDAPTADLMTTFYEQLQQNPDKAQALRQAMLITMEQHEDPIDWAAFTLIGAAQ